MRQIWQGLPNLGCNNQSMTSWKRTTGIWKTPKNKLSDFTATLYSNKGTQPGKVSSLWSRLSRLAICPTLINLFVDQAKNYLARVWGDSMHQGPLPNLVWMRSPFFRGKRRSQQDARSCEEAEFWGPELWREVDEAVNIALVVVLMQIHIYKRVCKFFFLSFRSIGNRSISSRDFRSRKPILILFIS